jgi:cardiolipin synthase
MSTTWQFHLKTDEVWQSMLEDIKGARETVDIEQFIVVADGIGKQFIDLLAEKAKRGVKVRLLVDYVGSFNFVNSASAKELEASGVQIRIYNPIKPWQFHLRTSWFLRDHRKILIVDQRIFHTGGVGIEDAMRDWRDTQVRFEGEVVNEAVYIFNRMWQMAGEGHFMRFRLDRFKEGAFRFLTNSPHFRQRYLYRRLRRSVARAKDYIYLTTPYFIPNSRFLYSLIRASNRGVDVRLITPEHSDHPFVDRAKNSYYTLCMRAGIKIYHYQGQVMHAKTAVIDDGWATVGSANLDNLSLLLNYEANVVSSDKMFVAAVKEQFINDMLSSVELEPEQWHSRPVWAKIQELLTWPFHGLM